MSYVCACVYCQRTWEYRRKLCECGRWTAKRDDMYIADKQIMDVVHRVNMEEQDRRDAYWDHKIDRQLEQDE